MSSASISFVEVKTTQIRMGVDGFRIMVAEALFVTLKCIDDELHKTNLTKITHK